MRIIYLWPVLWLFAPKQALAGIDEAEAAFNSQKYSVALQELRPLAEQGIGKAQSLLGRLYETGAGVDKNLPKAVELYQMAIGREEPSAMDWLAMMYINGKGVTHDRKRALELFTKAAEGGFGVAQLHLAQMYLLDSRDSDAFPWLERAANQDIVSAQYELGSLIERRGYASTPSGPDFREVCRWYIKAADQGFARAQVAAARCFMGGKGVKKDSRIAIRYATKAAESDDQEAQYILGEYYANQDDDSLRDDKEAYKWLYVASFARARASFTLAQNEESREIASSAKGSLNALSLELSAQEIEEAKRTGEAWLVARGWKAPKTAEIRRNQSTKNPETNNAYYLEKGALVCADLIAIRGLSGVADHPEMIEVVAPRMGCLLQPERAVVSSASITQLGDGLISISAGSTAIYTFARSLHKWNE